MPSPTFALMQPSARRMVAERRVELLHAARDDLKRLYDFIADHSGARVADRYIDRIEAACAALSLFSNRGVSREDMGPGIRIIGFERRATIVFQVEDASVAVVRVFYGGQDFEAAFEGGSTP